VKLRQESQTGLSGLSYVLEKFVLGLPILRAAMYHERRLVGMTLTNPHAMGEAQL